MMREFAGSLFSLVLLAGVCLSNELYPKRVISEFPTIENFWHTKTLEEVRTPFGAKIKTV